MKPLRIALTADPYLPVPPVHYGGIERVISLLADGLTERGHQVTLFAHPESRTRAQLIPYGEPPHFGLRARLAEVAQVAGGLLRRRHSVDVIHSFGRLAALLPVMPLRSLPKIQSYQRQIGNWDTLARAARLAGNSLRFTACSSSVYRAAAPRHGRWTTVFNGVDTALYTATLSADSDAPLVFLGRLEEIKGPQVAMEIARKARRRLILAGNKVSEEFFATAIAPHLDGEHIRWIGPVDDAEKNSLLGSAAALLMPILWDEPFGIVMAEAMACGTPVIAFPRGSVGEVVRHGHNGFIAHSADEAAELVCELHRIDRGAVRADCEARFSGGAIIAGYEQLYEEMTAQ